MPYRWTVDKQLRDAVIDLAGGSQHTNAWAADRYRRPRDRGHDFTITPTRPASSPRVAAHHLTLAGPRPYDPADQSALQRVLAQAA